MNGSPAGSDPERIGVYQIQASLGRGGMGEVYLAYDPRLERQVAIKRIRADRDSEHHLARFQREAKLAASFVHPNIVQVFDYLVVDEGEHIVMEYVAGRSLRTVIEEDGTLPLDRGLRVGRMVAEALAYAHERQVVHRDVKPDNVILTPDGQAKVTDFGIARRAVGALTDDTGLTFDGAILGTPGKMSPEQALGQEADARSDLFSLGVLLYEVFTGRAPFQGDSMQSTFQRVLTYQPPPVHQVRPSLPNSLSKLIAHLLAKDPAERLSSANAVVERLDAILAATAASDDDPTQVLPRPELDLDSLPTTTTAPELAQRPAWRFPAMPFVLVLLVVAVVAAVVPWLKPAESPSAPAEGTWTLVAVLLPELAPGTSGDMDRLLYAVRNAQIRAVRSLEGLEAADPASFDGITAAADIARAVSPDEILSSTLDCLGSDCTLRIRRTAAGEARILGEADASFGKNNLVLVTQSVEIRVREIYPDADLHAGVTGLLVSSEDFATYLDVKSRFDQGRGRDPEELLPALAALRESSPDFFEAALLDARAAAYFYDNAKTKNEEYRKRALESIAQAESLSPDDVDVLFERAYVESLLGDLDAAERTLAELAGRVPGDPRLLDRQASLLHQRGQHGEAMRLMQESIQRRPSWKRYMNYSIYAEKNGDLAAARQGARDLLDLHPNNVQGLSRLARMELESGRFAEAAALYEKLVELSSKDFYRMRLGLSYMFLRNYEASFEIFKDLYDANPVNTDVVLNLADTCQLLGRRQEAEALYSRLLELESDVSLVRAQALAQLGRCDAAVKTGMQAFNTVIAKHARGDATASAVNFAYFEVSLVYTLCEQYAIAAANAETALEGGLGRYWYRLPWFDK